MIYKRGGHWHLDVAVNGARYREALDTTDAREAKRLEKKRLAEIEAGKGASRMGREFARLPFGKAADVYLEERKPAVAERTIQLETQRLRPLRRFFGDRPVLRIKAADIANFQNLRRESGVSGRTINLEIKVLRQLMKRAKCWNVVAEDVRMDRENSGTIAKVLTPELKQILFQVAGTRP